MKRQQIILFVCGVLLAVVCAVAGWFLFTAVTAKNEAKGKRDQSYEALQAIYRAKVFPNETNIVQVAEDQKTLEAWLATASNLVHTGDRRLEALSPSRFKDQLTATVRKLSDHPGVVNGKIAAADFNFGFDQYLGGQVSVLPDEADVPRLNVQLVIIEQICEELVAADVLALKTVTREIFETAKAEGGEGQNAPSGRRRRDRGEPGAPAAKSAAADTSEFYSKQSFTFEFQARPTALVDALNRLAKMALFCTVAELEVVKSADSLAAYNTKKSGAGGAGARDGAKEEEDLSTVPHEKRVVTRPELEPPVNVKLVVDVYSFEGV